MRASARFAARGLHYVDCGTLGGAYGLERGYSLMIGCEREMVVFPILAPGARSVPRRLPGST